MRRQLTSRHFLTGFATVLAILILGGNSGSAQDASGAFTQAEVTAGHVSYHGYCASCHGDELQGGGLGGGGDALPLTGLFFAQDWSKYTIRLLYQFVSKTMPDGLAGDLSAKTYRNVIAFLLAANGAKPGLAPLDPNSNTKIGDITSGHLVTAVTDAPIDPGASADQ